MTDDVRDRLAALEHEVACSNVPTILGALDLFIAKLWADPSLLVVARPKCDCDDGMVTVGDGDYEGAGCHEEPCPDCDRGYLPMVALPAKVVEEWAARWAATEAVRLAREEE